MWQGEAQHMKTSVGLTSMGVAVVDNAPRLSETFLDDLRRLFYRLVFPYYRWRLLRRIRNGVR